MSDSTTAKLNSIEQKIDAQIARAKRHQMVTIVIGVILVIVVLGYTSYISGLLRDVLTPESTAEIASQSIIDRLPEVLDEVEKNVESEAPKLVDDLITQLINEQIPSFREAGEERIKSESSEQIRNMTAFLIAQIDTVIDENEERVNQMAELLETTEGKEQFQQEMYNLMKESLNDSQIQVELDSYGIALAEIESNLVRLTADTKDLTKEEQALFELLAVVREMANRSEFELKELPAVEGLEEVVE